MKSGRLAAFLSVFGVVSLFLSGCGGGSSGGGGNPPPANPTITSVSASCNPTSLPAGQTSQTSSCSASVQGTGSFSNAVTWSASVGTITASGVYTAPATVPSSGTATITATSTQDATKSGTAVVTVTAAVSAQPTPTTPMVVPSILVSGQQTQVTVTAFIGGANANTQVQLFNLAGGTAVLVGNMNDNGSNGDKTAGDQVYTIAPTITAPAAPSLPFQVVASPGTSVNFSVQVLQIPSYSTNADVNQAETQIYTTAIQTRMTFSSPDWSNQGIVQGVCGNLTSMFGEFSGVVNQNPALQSALVESRRESVRAHPANTATGTAEDALTSGLLSPAQNATSCNQLVGSLGDLRGQPGYPTPLDPSDPQLKEFANELAGLCPSNPQCQSLAPITADDLIGNGNPAAVEWAREYMVTGPSLPTPIGGCGGGVAQSLASVAVKSELQPFTDMAGNGISSLANLGQIGMQAVGSVADYMLGWFVDSSGNQGITVAQTAPTETFAAPTGTYNLAVSFGGDTANATITNTPVYPNSVTNISPSSGATITVTTPYVTGLTPAIGTAGTAVVVTGTGFDPTASNNEVTFNGTSAQVDSSTTASIQTSVPAGASSGPVSVTTSSGSTTSSLVFMVTGSSGNPPPTITSLFPNTATAAATSQLLSINGTGFVLSSTVTFNGMLHPASFVGTNRLTITLTSSDLATAGTYPVTVTNPAPGGGASSAANFTVTSTPPAGSGQWAWMSGGNQQQQSGVYGTPGVAAASNVPGARNYAVAWTDPSGNFWLFGGNGYDSTGASGNLNDLWKYSPVSGMWTWISGSQTANATGVYGTQGIPSAANVPGAREYAVGWVDVSGDLWLYGGWGSSIFDDLWKFDPTTEMWVCVGGCNQPGITATVYGTQGIASAANTPGSRYSAVTWADSNGNLWLFGGGGFLGNGGTQPTPAFFGDLWKYSPSTETWTWVSGSDTSNPSGVYGTQGVSSPSNTPGARQSSVTWTDASGNLWLFGGVNPQGNSAYGAWYNDLWEFSPTTGLWTWVSGSSSNGAPGVYGTQGVATAANVPGGRAASVGWTDGNNNLWLFGGGDEWDKWNDLWQYNMTTRMWTWVAGSDVINPVGSFGTMGVAASANSPSAKAAAVGFTDAAGRFWLFGGTTSVTQGTEGSGYDFNDLWRYQP